MPTMPGHGGYSPHVVARMIHEAKAKGKCAAVSTHGWVCTEVAGHLPTMHKAQDAFGNTRDTWIEAPGAWDPDEEHRSPTANRLLSQAQRADHIATSFATMVAGLEKDPEYDFVEVWAAVEKLIMAMPNALDGPAVFDLLSYFITRACWSDSATIPKEGP